ncbi:MAG: restriction endonuclease subunit S [Arcicella sp.]|jgi:type I restriction enzyme S subunit|nr:restriction endonuclease subunit S [Arcicella sp.]
MTSKKPKLRFPEFSDSWEEKKLGDLLEFKNGINADKEQYGSGTKFINVLDILNNDYITHERIIGRVNIDSSQLEKNLVSFGDILFQRSSETREEVGTANVYLDKEQNATFGGFVIRGKKIGIYNPMFLNLLLKTKTARESITSRSGGSTRFNIGQEVLSSITLSFPIIEEQTKIANFLTAIDKKINLLKEKKSHLEAYKKGIMQQIFNQERNAARLRFKKDDGSEFEDWKEKRVDDMFKVTRGNVLSMNIVKNKKSDDYIYPVYSSQTKNKGLAGFYNEYLFEDCITWTTDGANAGDVNFRKGKFYCTNVCGVLKSDGGFANQCIAEILNSITKQYVSYVGNPKLMNNVMSNIDVLVPESLEEQQKIASFLSAIDDKIASVSNAIETTQTYKKGLLQQMFC